MTTTVRMREEFITKSTNRCMRIVGLYCECITLHVNYNSNVIVDTIVNVISEVWIELSESDSQELRHCIQQDHFDFDIVIFLLGLVKCFILTMFKFIK